MERNFENQVATFFRFHISKPTATIAAKVIKRYFNGKTVFLISFLSVVLLSQCVTASFCVSWTSAEFFSDLPDPVFCAWIAVWRIFLTPDNFPIPTMSAVVACQPIAGVVSLPGSITGSTNSISVIITDPDSVLVVSTMIRSEWAVFFATCDESVAVLVIVRSMFFDVLHAANVITTANNKIIFFIRFR